MGTPENDALSIVRTLAASGESYYVEFKSGWTYGPDGRKARPAKDIAENIGKTIVAFANSDGGDLLVGVEDDGSLAGLAHGHDQLRYLTAWQQQLADGGDQVSVRVFSVDVDGHRVLMFRVGASESFVATTSDGRCLMRQKDASVPVSPKKIEQRREHVAGDRDYEAQPVSAATLDDLDWDLIRRSARGVGLRRKAAGSFDDDVAQLRYWNLVEQRNGSVVLRRAALLLFAKDPLRWHPNNRVRLRRELGASVGFGRNARGREREFLGPVAKVLIAARLALHRDLERESRTDQLFSTSTLLPREAVDECLVNAVVHRNYAIEGQAVEIVLFPDRVEFQSPGQLPDPIKIEDLAKQKGVHRSRNPIMMRVMRDLGWTRDQGEGMRRIFASMRQVELHEPVLELIGDTFTVRLSTRSVYDPQTQAWVASYGPFGLQPEERRYMVALREARGKLSVDRLARQLNESFDKVKTALVKLEQRFLVWHPKGTRTFHLVEPLNVPFERVLRTLEAGGIEPHRELVLDRDTIARVAKTTDQQTTSALIDQWKQAGILAPAGSKRWRLGASFATYLAQRNTK